MLDRRYCGVGGLVADPTLHGDSLIFLIADIINTQNRARSFCLYNFPTPVDVLELLQAYKL